MTARNNATGHKDARYDVPNAKFVAVDTWQKHSGQWKILAQAFVATDQIPSEAYKLPPPPGVQWHLCYQHGDRIAFSRELPKMT
jgi:hypothetical protein